MSHDTDDYLARHVQQSSIDLNRHIDELVAQACPGDSRNLPLYREMLLTVIRMAQADRDRWDAKIMLQTLRELEAAFRALEPFRRRRKVTVFGSARTPAQHPLYQQAKALGQELARYDMMAITGAGGGIMAAAHEGAGLESSLGLNITLPFEQAANTTVQNTNHLVSFHFFFLRKLFFVKEADALVLFPGGFGTLDEALEVLTLIQTGKSPLVPVVLIDTEDGSYWHDALAFMRKQLVDQHYVLPQDLRLVRLVNSPQDAVAEITRFYGNYHSTRWFGKEFVIRMNHRLSREAMEQLHQNFGDLCLEAGFNQEDYCRNGLDEAEFCHLQRLGFRFNGRDQGRLRELVDFINQPEHWA